MKNNIETFAIAVADIKKLKEVLNRYHDEGYAPLTATYINTRDGAAVLFTLGLVGSTAEAVDDAPTPDVDEEVEEKPANPVVTVSHHGGNGASLPDPTIVGAEI